MIAQLAQILESAAADRMIIGLQKNNAGSYCLTVSTTMSGSLPANEQGMAVRQALSVPLMANGVAEELDAGLTAQLAQYVASANRMMGVTSNIATVEATAADLPQAPQAPAQAAPEAFAQASTKPAVQAEPQAPVQTVATDFFSDIDSL